MKHKHRVLKVILQNHLGEKIDKIYYKSMLNNKLKVKAHVEKDLFGKGGYYVCLVSIKNNTYYSCQMIDWISD